MLTKSKSTDQRSSVDRKDNRQTHKNPVLMNTMSYLSQGVYNFSTASVNTTLTMVKTSPYTILHTHLQNKLQKALGIWLKYMMKNSHDSSSLYLRCPAHLHNKTYTDPCGGSIDIIRSKCYKRLRL